MNLYSVAFDFRQNGNTTEITVDRNEAVLFAYRVIRHRPRFNSRKAFSITVEVDKDINRNGAGFFDLYVE